MKLVLEEDDLNYIEKFKSDSSIPKLCHDGDIRYLKVTVKDAAKIQNFFLSFLSNNKNLAELEDQFGFSVESMFFTEPEEVKKEMKEKLLQLINENL